MPDASRVRFDDATFPLWVVVDSAVEAEIGESAATQYLTNGAGEKLQPLFTTEAAAREHIRRSGLGNHAPAAIASRTDLLVRLEQFRARGGTHVGINNPAGDPPEYAAIRLADFIAHVREG